MINSGSKVEICGSWKTVGDNIKYTAFRLENSRITSIVDVDGANGVENEDFRAETLISRVLSLVHVSETFEDKASKRKAKVSILDFSSFPSALY